MKAGLYLCWELRELEGEPGSKLTIGKGSRMRLTTMFL